MMHSVHMALCNFLCSGVENVQNQIGKVQKNYSLTIIRGIWPADVEVCVVQSVCSCATCMCLMCKRLLSMFMYDVHIITKGYCQCLCMMCT